MTTNDIKIILQNCIDSVRVHHPYEADILLQAFNTGLRINEIIDCERWVKVSGSYPPVSVPVYASGSKFVPLRMRRVVGSTLFSAVSGFNVSLSKFGLSRFIHSGAVINRFIPFYASSESQALTTYSSLAALVAKHMTPVFIYGSSRRTLLHLFRYYYIKNLNDYGYSYVQIRDIIGHKFTSTTKSYILESFSLVSM